MQRKFIGPARTSAYVHACISTYEHQRPPYVCDLKIEHHNPRSRRTMARTLEVLCAHLFFHLDVVPTFPTTMNKSTGHHNFVISTTTVTTRNVSRAPYLTNTSPATKHAQHQRHLGRQLRGPARPLCARISRAYHEATPAHHKVAQLLNVSIRRLPLTVWALCPAWSPDPWNGA